MSRLTLLETAKLNNSTSDAAEIIADSLNVAPEFAHFPVRSIKGTQYTSLIRTSAPTTQFVAPMQGVSASHSTFANEMFECAVVGGRVELLNTILNAPDSVTPEELKKIESAGVFESALQSVGRQIFYGTSALGGEYGFPGLPDFVSPETTVNAGGNAENAGSSVYFVKFGPRHIELLLGVGGRFDLGEWRAETIKLGGGKVASGEVADLQSWVGLKCVNKHSVVRIKNLTAQTSKGLNMELLGQARDLFPAGVQPDVIFMSRRSRAQLRATAGQWYALGEEARQKIGEFEAYAPTPLEFDGIPIVVTDSILNTEPIE